MKYYPYEEFIKMLPLLTQYAKDIRDLNREIKRLVQQQMRISIVKTNNKDKQRKNDQETKLNEKKLKNLSKKLDRWILELYEYEACIAIRKHGYIDIPIMHPVLNTKVKACIGPKTNPQTIFWHKFDETWLDNRLLELN